MIAETRPRVYDAYPSPEAVNGRTDVSIVVEANAVPSTSRHSAPTTSRIRSAPTRRSQKAVAGLFVAESAGQLPLALAFHVYGGSNLVATYDPAADDTALAVRPPAPSDGSRPRRARRGSEMDRETHKAVRGRHPDGSRSWRHQEPASINYQQHQQRLSGSDRVERRNHAWTAADRRSDGGIEQRLLGRRVPPRKYRPHHMTLTDGPSQRRGVGDGRSRRG